MSNYNSSQEIPYLSLKQASIEEIIPLNFELKLDTEFQLYSNHENKFSNKLKFYVIIVDDEYIIRNAMKRMLLRCFKEICDSAEVLVIEASDGIECLIALYLATIQNIKIDGVISDENMKFISGSFSSRIIEVGVKSGFLADLPMFIVTALGGNFNFSNYSSVVRKVFSKPIERSSAIEIIKILVNNKNNHY